MIRDIAGAGFLAPVLPAFPEGPRVTRWHFASVEDMAHAIPDTRPATAWADCGWTGSRDFTGTSTMQEARRLVLNGWPQGASNVDRIARTIALQTPQRPRVARWDVAGSVASIPRHLAGNPLAMRRIVTDDTRRRPVLTLLASAASHAGVDASAFIRAAGVAAAVTDRLEAAGFRVEILAACRGYGSDTTGTADEMNRDPKRAEVAWCAKAPEHAVDAGRLAVALGHPAMLRRFCFALWAMEPQCQRDLRGTAYGRSIQLAELTDRPAATFILPSPRDTPGNDLAAFHAALDSLRAQDCPGIPESLAA